MVKKISQIYLEIRQILLAREDAQTAAFIARNLICSVTGRSQEQMLADREHYISDTQCQQLDVYTKRVLAGEPLAYVLGEWDFYGLKLQVNSSVLIPRDDTCAVTELAIKQAKTLPHTARILDLCTGSGCIGLAVAKNVLNARITLADVSKDALAVARKNVAANGLLSRVSCVTADALNGPDKFLGKFDLIVSNPPYITSREMEELPHSVKDFEPHMALYGGDDGLDFYRAIADKYRDALKPGGYLSFEFGMGQGDAVCQILEQNGYTILERTKDFNQIERAVLAQWQEEDNYGYQKDIL